jgi:hypothetical protein
MSCVQAGDIDGAGTLLAGCTLPSTDGLMAFCALSAMPTCGVMPEWTVA